MDHLAFLQPMTIVAGIAILSMCLALMVAIRKWDTPKDNARNAQRYLLILVLILISIAIDSMLEYLDLDKTIPGLCKVLDPLMYLLAPMVSAYVLEINGKRFFVGYKRLFAHLAPMIAMYGLLIPFSLLETQAQQTLIKSTPSLSSYFLSNDSGLTIPLLNKSEHMLLIGIQFATYRLWLFKTLTKPFGGTRSQVRQSLFYLNTMNVTVFSLITAALANLDQYIDIVMLAFIFFFILYYLTWQVCQLNPTRSEETPKPLTPIITEHQDAEEPAKPCTPDIDSPSQQIEEENKELKLIFESLQEILEKGVYQNKTFSLRELADISGFRPQICSQAINEIAKKNFYDWVNGYRIEDAKTILLNERCSIDQLCDKVGFNSKSTFYTAFKKLEGMTPKQYKNRKQEEVGS